MSDHAADRATAVARAAGLTYMLRRVEPRCWSVVDVETGRPVAYPGIDLATAAASWLRWETGADDPTAVDLVDFAERVATAERRILRALQAYDRD